MLLLVKEDSVGKSVEVAIDVEDEAGEEAEEEEEVSALRSREYLSAEGAAAAAVAVFGAAVELMRSGGGAREELLGL